MNKLELLSTWEKEIQVVSIKGLQYDLEPIRSWFNDVVLPLPPAWQEAYDVKTNTVKKIPIEDSGGKGFGGWTVLGNDVDYGSAWLPNGYLPHWNLNIPQDFTKANLKTEICTGAMLSFITDLEKKGIHLSRARVTITKPGIGLKYHTDSNYPGELIVRLQFPIFSNSGVFFHSKTRRWNLVDDGSAYLVNTNHLHKVENDGQEIRFNLIADVDIEKLPNHDIYEILDSEEFHS